MKTFIYMGTNMNNVSRVSWKIWKIQHRGKRVTTQWGHAIVKNRRVVPKYGLNEKTRLFATVEAARKFADRV